MTVKSKQPLAEGHRVRLRRRFIEGGAPAVADYELLEMLLFAAHPRGDVKPLAKRLLKHFKSFAGVLRATPQALLKVEGAGEGAVAAIKTAEAAAMHLLRDEVSEGPIINSWRALLEYCSVSMGWNKTEEFRVLFLDQKHRLMLDEVQSTGTIDHAAVYPREILKRALELYASSMILVHNHPSGDPTPSKADITLTEAIAQGARPLGLQVQDHIIIGKKKHFSFKSNGLL